MEVRADEVDTVERLLGSYGPAPSDRLGLAPDATALEVQSAAGTALATWRRRAESPLAGPADVEAARVLVRTCEGLLAGASAEV